MIESTPGLDLERVERWLSSRVEMAPSALRARFIAGGKSNLTYEITDGHGRWIVRRPPLGHVLSSAHDMRREYRVMKALADTEVPVPGMIELCEDDAVLGAPFYVMEFVNGTPYRRRAQLEMLGAERTRALSERMVAVLADIHSVEPAKVGLDSFGRPDGYLTRQVATWKRQFDSSRSREMSGEERLHQHLAAAVGAVQAAAGPPAIVHGDYRLDNLLVTEDGGRDHVAAVVDWEMATLGDPLCDLGTLIVYQRVAELGLGDLTNDASLARGWMTEAEQIGAYAERSGRDMHDLSFYLALAAYKLAAIMEGIHYRHQHGETVGAGFEHVGSGTAPLIQLGLDAVAGRID